MLPGVESWMQIGFLAMVVVTLQVFFKAHGTPVKARVVLYLWLFVQTIISATGFYTNETAMPPRAVFLMAPMFLFVFSAISPKTRSFMVTEVNPIYSTALHSVRILVELVLFQLAFAEWIPELMTFEGRNFDILIGLSAPIMAYLVWKNKVSPKALRLWNAIGLAFVTFIFVNATLSAPLPVQQFAFDQPNRAVLYFPFTLLPGLLVPLVMYTHIVGITVGRRQ